MSTQCEFFEKTLVNRVLEENHSVFADAIMLRQTFRSEAIDSQKTLLKIIECDSGYHTVDERDLNVCCKLWDIPNDVYKTLQYFTGELQPYKDDTRDKRRMFFDEMTEKERKTVLDWFANNKVLILSDILRGRGEFCAKWVLVAQKVQNNAKWVLKNINEVMQHYSQGNTTFSPRGSIKIGRITVQRKGGDGGRDTANMLQFKINPLELFDL